MQQPKMIFPDVQSGNVGRRDAEHVDAADKGQPADVRDPRSAMDSERVPHIVWMIIENDDLDGFPKDMQPFDQEITDMVIIAAPEKYRPRGVRDFFSHRAQSSHRTTEADPLLPRRQR